MSLLAGLGLELRLLLNNIGALIIRIGFGEFSFGI